MDGFAKGIFFKNHLLCSSDALSACRFEKSVLVSQQFDIINRVAHFSRLSAVLQIRRLRSLEVFTWGPSTCW